MAKNIVVTGAAGFLGTHLSEKLLKEGHHVLGVDNFMTGSQESVTRLMKYPGFEFLFHDVIHPLDLKRPYDQFIHLACPASPIHYQKNPIYTLKIAFLGMLNVLEAARHYNASVVQASTSEVYGSPNEHPQSESYWGNVNPHGVRACYDEGKRVAEALCFDYRRQYGLSVRVARLFNTYGPGMRCDDGRVVSSLIIDALLNRPLTIHGAGAQTRSFCYVDDTITGLLRLAEEDADGGGPFNIGNPHEITIKELAHLVIAATRSQVSFAHHSLPEDDPPRRCPDISRIFRAYRWQPEVGIERGLNETVNYFKSHVYQCDACRAPSVQESEVFV
jgi:UDP-glucuronate decarboxylase